MAVAGAWAEMMVKVGAGAENKKILLRNTEIISSVNKWTTGTVNVRIIGTLKCNDFLKVLILTYSNSNLRKILFII